jgi:hypothetical protein
VKHDPKILIYSLFPNVVKNMAPGSQAAPKKQRATKRNNKGRGRRAGQRGPLQMEDLLGESVPALDEPGHDADDDLVLGPLAEKRQRLASDGEEQLQFQPYIPPRARAPSPPGDLATVTAVDEDGFAPGELDAMLLDAARSLETELN